MSISWLTPQGQICELNEEDPIPAGLSVKFKAVGKYTYRLLSNGLPSGITVNDPVDLGNNEYEIRFDGIAPSVKIDKDYFICFRLKQEDELIDATYSIRVKNKKLKWDAEQPSLIEMSLFTNTRYKLRLLNTNGNEQILKVGGVIPAGLTLDYNGTLFGTINEADLIGKDIAFTVSVFINGKEQRGLEKTFTIRVIPADPYEKPKWISNTGFVGTLKSGQRSELVILASNSTVTQQVYYELLQSNLPDGIAMNELGQLVGTCATNYTQNWYFTAVAYKMVNGTKVSSDPREFFITTNPSSRDDNIEWDTVGEIFNFGSISIGEKFNGVVKAHTASGLEVTFTFVGDSAPKGLTITKDGQLYGVIEPQKVGVYTFSIQASAGSNKSVKTCTVELKTGLGAYAMTLSLVLCLQYQSEYTDLKTRFTSNSKYQPRNPNYITGTTPKIDVAYIKTFDKEILPLLIDIGQPEWIRFHKTI